MASLDKELEKQLMEAGNKLVNPPSSVDELITLLDQVENCLSKVDQCPTKSMQSALAPLVKALVADQLFRHSDVDVNVAVASCISEITRITAPDAPYDDDQMKDVFQLIVSCFENLADKSSRSYIKRASILETVAKVRSCVVMLDIECDALIIEMFQHFLNTIRDYHPENVTLSMETIMTLVLEESEDISSELLSTLLASMKRDNKEVLPVARKLGEKVIEGCATKVKPYLQQAMKSLGVCLDDYSDIVASICQEISGAIEQNETDAADENKQVEEIKRAGPSSEDGGKTIAAEAGCTKQTDPSNERSPKAVLSNGVAQPGEDESLADSSSLKKQDEGNQTGPSKSIEISSNAETSTLDADKLFIEESKVDQATKKSGRKVNTSTKLIECSEICYGDDENEAHKQLDDQAHSKDFPSSLHEEPLVEAALSSDNKKEAVSCQPTSPKAQEGKPVSVASLSGSGSLPDESLSKKAGRTTMKRGSLTKDSEPASDDASRKAPEKISKLEAKPNKRSSKKAAARISNEDKDPMMTDATKKQSDTTSESEANQLKQSSKKVNASGNIGDGSSLNQPEDKKQRSRGKSISEKNLKKKSTKDEDKEKVYSPKSAAKLTKVEKQLEEIPKTITKRKRTSGNEKGFESGDRKADLVGSRVKVWWPKDRQFYVGVIRSYDPARKKHEVWYDDGDTEILNLRRQIWKFVPDEGQAASSQSTEVLTDMPPKKKAKTNSDQSSKQGKVDASRLRGDGASSSKSKSAAAKSVQKLKADSKMDSKSMDDSSAAKKTDDDNASKNQDNSSKSGGKSVDVIPRTGSKAKNDDSSTSKSAKSKENDDSRTTKSSKSKENDDSRTTKSSKSKQETVKSGKSKQDSPKVTSNAKSKSSKSGGKSSDNDTEKLKSVSSKVKETEGKEESTDSGKLQESVKRKSLSSSKGQESEKKRRKT